jgi:hypothetical protein
VLLKLTVVLSTGLLTVQTIAVSDGEVSILLDLGGSGIPGLANSTDYSAITYYGATQKGLEWPPRTTANASFQELSTSNIFKPNVTVVADVLAFFPTLRCETAQLRFTMLDINGVVTQNSSAAQSLDTGFQSDTCSGKSSDSVVYPYCYDTRCNTKEMIGRLDPVYCSSQDIQGDGLDNSWLIWATELNVEQLGGPLNPDTSAVPFSVSIAWSTAVLCTGRYSIETANLTVDFTENVSGRKSLSGPLTSTGNMISGYPYGNLTADVSTLIGTGIGANFIPGPAGKESDTLYDDQIGSFFNLMMLSAGVTDLAAFRDDVSLLANSANQVFMGLASQAVGSWLSFPDRTSTTGLVSYPESRLLIEPSSALGMVVTLGACMVCVALILALRNPSILSWQSSNALTALLSLRSSPSLNSTLSGLGCLSDKELEHLLSNNRFTVSTSQNHLQIVSHNDSRSHMASLRHEQLTDGVRWWRAPSMKGWFYLLSLVSPLVVIAALEVLQRFSDANNGVGIEAISAPVAAALTAYIPAAVMLAIAGLFSSAEFTFTLLAPYLLIKEGKAKIHDLKREYLGKLPVMAALEAARSRQFAVSSVILSSILGSLITMISSGLYSIEPISKIYDTVVQTTDQFNLNWNDTTNLNALTMYRLIHNHNATYPIGTYNEFAYPLFELDPSSPLSNSTLQSDHPTSIEIRMPVIRPSLNCSVIPHDQLEIVEYTMARNDDPSALGKRVYISTIVDLPAHCQHVGSYANATQINITAPTDLVVPDDGLAYCAWTHYPFPTNEDQLHFLPENYPPNCPSLTFQFLEYDRGSLKSTLAYCSQYHEEIPASMTFKLPDMVLDTSKPPVLHEEESKVVSESSFNYWTLAGWMAEYRPLTRDNYPDSGYASSMHDLDPNFDYLINGPNGVPPSEFAGVANQDRLLAAMQHAYRQLMAQVIGDPGTVRLTVVNSTTQDVSVTPLDTQLSGRVYEESGSLRIVQHRLSTTLLQAVLGAMVLLLLAGCRTWRALGSLVKHNPCCMAGRMSLLAGSSLVDNADNERLGGMSKHLDGSSSAGQGILALGLWDEQGHLQHGAEDFGAREWQATRWRFGIDTRA